MDLPRIERYGDSFALTFDELHVGFSFERLRRGRDGLQGVVTVEAQRPDVNGRVLGPINIQLEDVRSQTNVANGLVRRVNHLDWLGLTVAACAVVAKQFSAPSPTVKLKNVTHTNDFEYLLPGLIPKGETTFIYGDSESCKSLIALLIGMSVQSGVAVPWGVTPEQANVLYLDYETNDQTIARRMRRLKDGHFPSDELPDLDYRGTMRGQADSAPLRLLDEEMQTLRTQIVKDNIGLVIVDSIGFAVRGKLTDDDVSRQAMMDLRLLSPATRLVVAHISKDSAQQQSSKRVDPFGSAFFRAGLRSGFEVRRSTEGEDGDHVEVGIYHWKSNDSKHVKPFGLTIDFTDESIYVNKTEIMDVADLAIRTPLSTRVRGMLKHGAVSTKQLADDLDTTEATIRNTLKRMNDVQQLNPGAKGIPATWGLSAEHSF